MTILAAIVLAPIGLGVLIFGGILAVAVGMSFAGAGSGVRSGDQPLAVVGTIVGAGEAVLRLLAVLAWGPPAGLSVRTDTSRHPRCLPSPTSADTLDERWSAAT